MSPTRPLSSPGIALRVTHPSYSPDEIGRGLELVATHSRSARVPNTERGNYWLLGLRARSEESVEEDVERFLKSLLPRREFLLNLRITGGNAALYLTWSAGHPSGFVFGVDTLVLMAELRLDLMVEAFSGAS